MFRRLRSLFGLGRSLSARILVGATTAVGIALLLSTAYFSIDQRASLDRLFEKQSQNLVDSLGAFAIEQLVSLDYPSLEYAIAVAGKKNDSILFIDVLHQRQSVARFGDPDSEGKLFSSEIRWREDDASSIGEVRVIFSSSDRDELQAASLRDHLITMLLIFVVMFISLRWLLRRTVIGPIERLTSRTEQAIVDALPELALGARSAEGSIDEIQLLDERFVRLLEGLKRRDRARSQAELALVEHQNNLERLVEARTHELRLAQEEATRLTQVKSEFLAAASHDLRQPLQAINLFHSVLKGTGLNDEQQRLSHCLSLSLISLGDLLNALLDISKLDAGRIKAVPEVIQVEALFGQIDAEFSSLAFDKGLRFKLYFPFRQLAIVTDPKLLLSMLNNLIGNAIKYTDEGGVLVGIRRRGGRAVIQVWDTGVGIADEHAQKIYDEYFQVGNQARDRTKGLGLGLSIVKRLAKLLGTEVVFRSSKGRGSVFEFSLPLASEAGQIAAELSRPVTRTPLNVAHLDGRRVVIVEDDVLLARALEVALTAQRLVVVSYASAEEALSAADIGEADIYLSDFRLPGMDGVEMLRAIQGRVARPIRALILTGETLPERIKIAESSGWHVLFKPVDFPLLLSELESLFD